jgi:hypothetical protein
VIEPRNNVQRWSLRSPDRGGSIEAPQKAWRGDPTRRARCTPQRFPRAGSQSYPTPAAKASADGSTTVYFAPTKPESVSDGNWIQTDPEKGWFTILRLYSPLEPFFTKEWRPSEIELVK